MLKDLSVQEFTQRLADSKPTPGGGSAAAMAGAMGASLVSMFCTLTAGKKKFAAVKEVMEEVASYCEERRAGLVDLVDRDSAAFDKILVANRMPKDSAAENHARQQAIDSATLEATQVPLETATNCVQVLERIPSLAANGNLNALSDLKVGMELLFTAFGGASANVEINLPWLTDVEITREIKNQLADLTARAQGALKKGREEISGLQ